MFRLLQIHPVPITTTSQTFIRNATPCRCLSLCFNNSINRKNFSSQHDATGTHPTTTTNNLPRLSVAVVGAGPSGFYATKYLASSVQKQIKANADTSSTPSTSSSSSPEPRTASSSPPSPSFPWSGVDIDILERLPTPFGLVRYGVAPDHPEVKNVEHDFAAILEKQKQEPDSTNSTIYYYGNVTVGTDISLTDLQSLYDVVILAYGCQAADKQLGIPGEDSLDGVMSAREFVAWYNGHPDFGSVGEIIKRCLWKDGKTNDADAVSPARVVVIGQGNVALDCARILAKGKSGLEETDIPTNVLEVLRGGVSHVSVVGRRGHVQGAFTIKELRELTKLKEEGHDASFIVREEELQMGMTPASIEELSGPTGRPKTRVDKLLHDAAAKSKELVDDSSRKVEVRFLMSPKKMEPNDSNTNIIGSVLCERTKLEGEPTKQRPVGTGEIERIPADLVLVSIGYRGMPLNGMSDDQMFDTSKGVVANIHGKVLGNNNLFVTGWIKRGATGIIGTNIVDAKDTVSSVMQFLAAESGQSLVPSADKENASSSEKGRNGLIAHLRTNNVGFVSWEEFLRIDESEKDSGRLRNDVQPREKMLTVQEMFSAAHN